MRIAVVGTGYVGLVAGTCFAESGNTVVCVDIDQKKIDGLKAGRIPIYEPGLEEMVKHNVTEERLTFTTNTADSVRASDVIFIAVGTPPGEDGSADLKYVLAVAREVGKAANGPKIIVDKSTCRSARRPRSRPPRRPRRATDDGREQPEFLKEGAAIEDFMKPDRVVIGVDDAKAGEVMTRLYTPFVRDNPNRIILMDIPAPS
jgi:UDPglucose 6-dehydrogenase